MAAVADDSHTIAPANGACDDAIAQEHHPIRDIEIVTEACARGEPHSAHSRVVGDRRIGEDDGPAALEKAASKGISSWRGVPARYVGNIAAVRDVTCHRQVRARERSSIEDAAAVGVPSADRYSCSIYILFTFPTNRSVAVEGGVQQVCGASIPQAAATPDRRIEYGAKTSMTCASTNRGIALDQTIAEQQLAQVLDRASGGALSTVLESAGQRSVTPQSAAAQLNVSLIKDCAPGAECCGRKMGQVRAANGLVRFEDDILQDGRTRLQRPSATQRVAACRASEYTTSIPRCDVRPERSPGEPGRSADLLPGATPGDACACFARPTFGLVPCELAVSHNHVAIQCPNCGPSGFPSDGEGPAPASSHSVQNEGTIREPEHALGGENCSAARRPTRCENNLLLPVAPNGAVGFEPAVGGVQFALVHENRTAPAFSRRRAIRATDEPFAEGEAAKTQRAVRAHFEKANLSIPAQSHVVPVGLEREVSRHDDRVSQDDRPVAAELRRAARGQGRAQTGFVATLHHRARSRCWRREKEGDEKRKRGNVPP